MKEPTTSTRWSSANASPAFPPTADGGGSGRDSGFDSKDAGEPGSPEISGVFEPATRPARSRLIPALTIFVSAFLLFAVQPIIARVILPWFGGSAAVWTVCMLFFQIALLAGYLYAHFLSRKLSAKRQMWVHLGLLAVSLTVLPIIPATWWKPAPGQDPTLRILGLLAFTIGLPYCALSATSPLLQFWLARGMAADFTAQRSIYRLFALSNFGSLLALASYPLLIEPLLPVSQQALVWSICYIVFALLCGWTARSCRAGATDAPSDEPPGARTHLRPATPPPLQTRLAWIALPACGSALLLAFTNHISQNIAAIPLLWVLPLGLYLLSFILCFESPRWYPRSMFLGLFAVAVGATAYAISGKGTFHSIRVAVPLFCLALFVCCMTCHGELARLRPDSSRLTAFYLCTSAGGALGGLFVALFAPSVFPALFELPVALCATAFLILYVTWRDRPRVAAVSPGIRRTAAEEFSVTQWRSVWFASACLSVVLTVFTVADNYKTLGHAHRLARNFYGALRVVDNPKTADEDANRLLVHGTISHGEQLLDPDKRRKPTTYYGPGTGINLTLLELGKPKLVPGSGAAPNSVDPSRLRVGVIGLGAGTLAAYGRTGDYYRIYEINPLVVKIAREDFTYLSDCPAQVEVILGDARLSLEKEAENGASQRFDVLAVDAFSGDSIPVHLLTQEAMALYWRHLKPDGVLAVHVSNKYLDLAPVVKMGAATFHKRAELVENERDDDIETFAASWVLVTSREELLHVPDIAKSTAAINTIPKLRLWTDDYSNLIQILK